MKQKIYLLFFGLIIIAATAFIGISRWENNFFFPASAQLDTIFEITSAPTVAPEDLINAGYNNVRIQEQTGTRFQPPVHYFRVSETTNNPEWGEAANLVAVHIKIITDYNWLYNNGQPEWREISGKPQLRLSWPGYYLVITGPDQTKVAALAEIIKNK